MPIDVSDKEFLDLINSSQDLKKNIECRELVALLEKLIPKFQHLRNYRSITLKENAQKHQMYKMVITKDDLHFPDFDPIVSAWTRNELQKLQEKENGDAVSLSKETYPKKGEGMPQLPAGFSGAARMPEMLSGGHMMPSGGIPGRNPVEELFRNMHKKKRKNAKWK